FSLTLFLGGCGSSEDVSRYGIVTDCSGVVCSIAVDNINLIRYTNLLGKTVDHIVKEEPVQGLADDIVWVINGGQYATNTQLSNHNLTQCADQVCTDTTNPTGYVFDSLGPKEISVSGTVVNSDGATQEINLGKSFTVEMGDPRIISEVMTGLYYRFTVDIEDTGIPGNATFAWKVNGTQVGTGQEVEYLFPEEGVEYTVTLEVSVDGTVVATAIENITTGKAGQPVLSSQQTGSNPLKWTIVANTTGTVIDDSWTKQWLVDGNIVSGEATNTLAYAFPLTSTVYTVEYIATKDGQTRQAITALTTASAIAPVIQGSSVVGDSLVYNLTATLQNTGITDEWTLKWGSNPSAIFTDVATSQTQVTFGSYDTVYTVSLTATPPSATITPVTVAITIDTGSAPAYTQAIYIVDSTTGTTAQAVANYYNSTVGLPGGVASIAASGDNLIFMCKSGYEIAGVAATLATGSFTEGNRGLQPVRTPTAYSSVLYISNNASLSSVSVLGEAAYNGFDLGGETYAWGVNCYVSNS
ncbi:DUF3281 family protein, partial [Allofrancisella guangzhouensis]